MSYANLSKIQSSSLFPGLQTVGTASTLMTLSGIVPAKGNLIGNALITFPQQCMAVTRVNLPDAHGELASKWFPLIGSLQLYDATSQWYLSLYTQPDARGRNVNIDFTSNDAVNNTTLSGFRISFVTSLFSYPF